jgi:cell division protein FtsL
MLTKLRDDAPWRIHRDLGYDQFANSSKLRSQRIQNQGAVQKRERARDMFEGVDRNRNIMIAAAVVVVILVIIYLYTAGHLSGIV